MITWTPTLRVLPGRRLPVAGPLTPASQCSSGRPDRVLSRLTTWCAITIAVLPGDEAAVRLGCCCDAIPGPHGLEQAYLHRPATPAARQAHRRTRGRLDGRRGVQAA